VPWTPVLPVLAGSLQVGLLLMGLIFSVVIAYRIARQHAQTDAQAWRGTLPVAGFLTGVTLTFLRLYLG
jgi:hypothetical protein